jgi:hypothetical protein
VGFGAIFPAREIAEGIIGIQVLWFLSRFRLPFNGFGFLFIRFGGCFFDVRMRRLYGLLSARRHLRDGLPMALLRSIRLCLRGFSEFYFRGFPEAARTRSRVG